MLCLSARVAGGTETARLIAIAVNLPADSARISIPLTALLSPDQQQSMGYNKDTVSEPVPAALAQYAQGRYKHYFALAKDPSGRACHVLAQPADDLNFLSSTSNSNSPMKVLP